jgi:hypothetical protein
LRNDTKEDEIAGHIAHTGEKRNDFKVLGENLIESDDFAWENKNMVKGCGLR